MCTSLYATSSPSAKMPNKKQLQQLPRTKKTAAKLKVSGNFLSTLVKAIDRPEELTAHIRAPIRQMNILQVSTAVAFCKS